LRKIYGQQAIFARILRSLEGNSEEIFSQVQK